MSGLPVGSGSGGFSSNAALAIPVDGALLRALDHVAAGQCLLRRPDFDTRVGRAGYRLYRPWSAASETAWTAGPAESHGPASARAHGGLRQQTACCNQSGYEYFRVH